MTKRAYLNLSAGTWRRLRREWNLPATPALLWQMLVPGSLFSLLGRLQARVLRRRGATPSLAGSVVILGYWRSGTTLLHHYLACDKRFGFPTTYACMNPHHFLLTEGVRQGRQGQGARRVVDDMWVALDSPQEDEFALLSLGARSPYEALLAPNHFAQCLALSDLASLSPADARRWRSIFLAFVRAVSVSQGGRPLILKSPPHGYRCSLLRELLPDARFVLIVREPFTVFESTVAMWQSLFRLYAMADLPSDSEIRTAVLADRSRFEGSLAAGLEAVPADRLTLVRYEDLVERPSDVVAGIYDRLELGDFATVKDALAAEAAARRGYRAAERRPSEPSRTDVARAWGAIFERYGYPVSVRG
jgi:hypothetical protein